jgi:hypothetical protein
VRVSVRDRMVSWLYPGSTLRTVMRMLAIREAVGVNCTTARHIQTERFIHLSL